MNILITGAKGFIGQNVVAQLNSIRDGKAQNAPIGSGIEIMAFDVDTDFARLADYCARADFILHLAGVNRPPNPEAFMAGNCGFTQTLLDTLSRQKNTCPIMLASSTQAALDNPYGASKRAGEALVREYGINTGAKTLIYRFPNVFGKWCRPNYNSAVATFCHNTANGLPIQVNDPSVIMRLVYIDDVVLELTRALAGKENRTGDFCEVPVVLTGTLGFIADAIASFPTVRAALGVPDMNHPLIKALYATYLSYVPLDKLSITAKMNVDDRGSFTELVKTADRGQCSVNVIKPGITKGNHWHHTKNERFIVVQGQGMIRFRKVYTDAVYEYPVSGDSIEIIDIPPGVTHNIENVGTGDMVTVMWCNECFDKDNPDTFFEPV